MTATAESETSLFETEDHDLAVEIVWAINRTMEHKCAECGSPATCFGSYESEYTPAYACDECCGHGCEDGHCDALKEVEMNREMAGLRYEYELLKENHKKLKIKYDALSKKAEKNRPN